MAKVDRLLRAKRRLSVRHTRADERRLDRDKPVRPKRWLRTRIYRIDLLLEREGLL